MPCVDFMNFLSILSSFDSDNNNNNSDGFMNKFPTSRRFSKRSCVEASDIFSLRKAVCFRPKRCAIKFFIPTRCKCASTTIHITNFSDQYSNLSLVGELDMTFRQGGAILFTALNTTAKSLSHYERIVLEFGFGTLHGSQ